MRTRLWLAPLLLGVAFFACDGDGGVDETGDGTDGASGGASGGGGTVPGNAPGGGGSATGPRTVTLVTGDRVTVFEGGRHTIEPVKGRARAPFHTRHEHGHLHVVPGEAERLLAAGMLDPRLFDVTALLELQYDDAHRADLPLIVSYRSDTTRAAPDARLSAAGVQVVHRLASINGASVRAPRGAARAVWSALAGAPSSTSRSAPALAGGIAKVWLDGKRKLVLDRSAPQIGAPEAWAAGLTGAGVTVAVLDTGIDTAHADFAGRIVEARSFLDWAPDALDEVGHGTHVASILAGSGAASDGKYRGIAPDALLLVGKVCDFECPDSSILAGMEWAATSGAVVVNMSLGGIDTPEMDPVEEAINTLTAEHGILFVVASGNEGTCGGSDSLQVASPSTADAALSVGAVDPDDELASFSCRGPRIGDGGLKPDITAPGVAIAAARAAGTPLGDLDPVDDFYARLDGTSMATPHVAGAAALLSQQHPDWRADDLKGALMASAEPNAELTVFQQGTGRVAVERAIVQDLVASPASLSLGRALWPHDDDEPIARSLTYRNHGADPIVLSLAFDVTGPDGAAAPAGMFTVAPAEVTVPAGGEAQVSITADTRAGDSDGRFAGALVATGAGQSLRTTVAVEREVESYELELVHIDREGNPGIGLSGMLNLDSGDFQRLESVGTSTMRLPRGRYLLDGRVEGNTPSGLLYVALLMQPLLELDADMTITLDAREAQPVRIVVPPPSAVRLVEQVIFLRHTGAGPVQVDHGFLGGFGAEVFFDLFYTKQLGEAVPAAELATWVQSQWAEPGPENSFVNSPYTYDLSFFPERGRFPDGFERTVHNDELATVRNSYAAQGPDQYAFVSHYPSPDAEFLELFTQGLFVDLPMRRRVSYLSTEEMSWVLDVREWNLIDFPWRTTLRVLFFPRYEAGRHYRSRWNDAVLGPDVSVDEGPGFWMTRLGDEIDVSVASALRRDRDGHLALPTTSTGHTRVFRDGSLVGENDEPGNGLFAVPPEPAEYRVEVQSIRDEVEQLSTQVDVAWTFRSGQVAGEEPAPLPILAVRFTPDLDDFNRAPSDRPFLIPITVTRHTGAPAASLRDLTVDASYDGGKSWSPALVIRLGDVAVALVRHPPGEGLVSLRATAVDKDDNRVEQTILGGYRLRER